MMIRLNNLDSYDEDFKMNGNVATSIDPRLKNIDGIYQALDAIPRNGKLSDPINVSYTGQNQTTYQSVSDIRLGDITYYMDPWLGQPFLPVIFTNTHFTKEKYIDPMGVEKSYYTQCVNPCPEKVCQSWINDSNKQREEIISRNMAKMNQTNFNVEMNTF